MIVHVLHYYYPAGSFAGIVGVFADETKAKEEMDSLKATHSDCTIVLTTCGVQ